VKLREVLPEYFSGLTGTISSINSSHSSHNNIIEAINMHQQGKISQAEQEYLKLIESGLDDPRIFANLAAIEFTRLNYQQARDLLYDAHRLRDRPCNDAYLISLLSLSLSDFPTAWNFYEYRWLNSFIPKINTVLPVINEDDDQWNCPDLLLHQDGGLGDHIFILQLLKHADIQIYGTFLGSKPACNLLRYIAPSMTVAAHNSVVYNRFNHWIPFQSLLRITQAPEIFINAPRCTNIETSSPLGINHRSPRIGIHWQGNSLNELFLIKGTRSLCLSLYSDIILSRRYSLYSLQIGRAANDLERFPKDLFVDQLHLGNIDSQMYDLMETIKKMDLVVCGDSFVANLAGFLEIPTLLIISQFHDWRWAKRSVGSSSFWYPSITILECQTLQDSPELRLQICSRVAAMI
jgi:tetratricopeptide (TPR) repeat protein